ncbi:unnamed protein product [Prunus armeniaca]
MPCLNLVALRRTESTRRSTSRLLPPSFLSSTVCNGCWYESRCRREKRMRAGVRERREGVNKGRWELVD